MYYDFKTGLLTLADLLLTTRSTVAMSRRVSSPTGNYYKFVYDEDSDDDNGDNDDTLPPISPDEEPELLPEM